MNQSAIEQEITNRIHLSEQSYNSIVDTMTLIYLMDPNPIVSSSFNHRNQADYNGCDITFFQSTGSFNVSVRCHKDGSLQFDPTTACLRFKSQNREADTSSEFNKILTQSHPARFHFVAYVDAFDPTRINRYEIIWMNKWGAALKQSGFVYAEERLMKKCKDGSVLIDVPVPEEALLHAFNIDKNWWKKRRSC